MPDEAYPLLLACKEMYREAKIPAVLLEPDEATPYHTLILDFAGIGNAKRNLRMELSFILGPEYAAEGVQILQTFASFEINANSDAFRELSEFVHKLNFNLPLGMFLPVSEAEFAFKANHFMDTHVPMHQNLGLIDRHNGMVLHMHQQFLDVLYELAEGMRTSDEVVKAKGLY